MALQGSGLDSEICRDMSQTPSYMGDGLSDNKNPLSCGGRLGVLFLIVRFNEASQHSSYCMHSAVFVYFQEKHLLKPQPSKVPAGKKLNDV